MKNLTLAFCCAKIFPSAYKGEGCPPYQKINYPVGARHPQYSSIGCKLTDAVPTSPEFVKMS